MSNPVCFPPLGNAWYLTGPTASGKSRVGIELAERLGAEIISLDSMAIYRGMDIGTAKPPVGDRQRVPHHMLDVVDPNTDFSLSEYVAAVHDIAADQRAAGRQILLVGGTPLYLKALLRGLYTGPPADWQFRRQVEEELTQYGIEALHKRLELVDPLTAARLHPHDKRRIIRALEVFRRTGEPISHQQVQFEEGTPAERNRVFVLAWSRAELHRRIEARVENMFARGLVGEVQALLERYGRLSRTALQAVGYREVIDHLGGACGLSDTIERVKARTRQFARRQDTWFRSLSECRPIPQDAHSSLEQTVSEIMRVVASSARDLDPPSGHTRRPE